MGEKAPHPPGEGNHELRAVVLIDHLVDGEGGVLPIDEGVVALLKVLPEVGVGPFAKEAAGGVTSQDPDHLVDVVRRARRRQELAEVRGGPVLRVELAPQPAEEPRRSTVEGYGDGQHGLTEGPILARSWTLCPVEAWLANHIRIDSRRAFLC